MKRICPWLLATLTCVPAVGRVSGADITELKSRRERAAKAFSDGVLLLHSRGGADFVLDGYREEAAFYYVTGLENSPDVILAIEGKTGQCWLFVPQGSSRRTAEIEPGKPAEEKLGVDHVVEWGELEGFLEREIAKGAKLYYKPDVATLPQNLTPAKDPRTPCWIQVLQQRWPKAEFRPVGRKLTTLMAVESRSERHDSEMAARATAFAFFAGMRATHPGASQRLVELAVVDACWKQARGVSFWPWAMAGPNGVFPKPFESDSRYDHLDSRLQSGDLVRLDVGCEWNHYQGDLGRTIPVSGHFSDEQREVWNIFVATYRAVARELKEGLTEDEAFEIWRTELLSHRNSAKTAFARQAIASWSDRENVPYWQMHTMNLDAGYIEGTLRAGMVIDLEPIASIGGQGYYLEDMFLIDKNAAELLTPGLPYTAEEIEAEMAVRH